MIFRPDTAQIYGQNVQIQSAFSEYDPAAEVLFAAMSVQPDSTRRQVINTAISSLKNEGIWSLLDELWFLAAHDAQAARLGWKRYRDITLISTPTFTTDRGYAGNGSTTGLNTNYVPSTDGVNYTLNDASYGVYSRTNNAANVRDIGARTASNNRQSNIIARWTDNRFYPKTNTNLASTHTGAIVSDSLGLFTARRTSSTAATGWKNGVNVYTGSFSSSNVPEYAFYICGTNNAGTLTTPTTRQYAFAYVGASLSTSQQLSLYNIVQAYMTSVGANV